MSCCGRPRPLTCGYGLILRRRRVGEGVLAFVVSPQNDDGEHAEQPEDNGKPHADGLVFYAELDHGEGRGDERDGEADGDLGVLAKAENSALAEAVAQGLVADEVGIGIGRVTQGAGEHGDADEVLITIEIDIGAGVRDEEQEPVLAVGAGGGEAEGGGGQGGGDDELPFGEVMQGLERLVDFGFEQMDGGHGEEGHFD